MQRSRSITESLGLLPRAKEAGARVKECSLKVRNLGGSYPHSHLTDAVFPRTSNCPSSHRSCRPDFDSAPQRGGG